MIFTIMGKSASGKDTVLRKLMEKKEELNLEEVIPYTTRPIRSGEKDGVDYYFVGEEDLTNLQRENKVVEYRVYHTLHGDWYYFTVDEEKLWKRDRRFLYITTLEAYQKIKNFYGEDRVVPIYLEVGDFIRLSRALAREKLQEKPSCAEVCRRFLADEQDFNENRLKELGIEKKYDTEEVYKCCQNIINEIKRY